MSREPLEVLDAAFIALPRRDIDTDQIIPARFLTAMTRDGLGAGLFADWRRDERGEERPEFELNRPEARDAKVLVAGENFGCGSSREHAPWALLEAGFRAVISTSIADIFKANALKNGLLPVVVEPGFHERLIGRGHGRVTVDLQELEVRADDGTSTAFSVDAFSRYCLLNGVDELGFLRARERDIDEFEAARPSYERGAGVAGDDPEAGR